jgi:hypothetical protein
LETSQNLACITGTRRIFNATGENPIQYKVIEGSIVMYICSQFNMAALALVEFVSGLVNDHPP